MNEKVIKAKSYIALAKQELTKILNDKSISEEYRADLHYAMFRLIQADKRL